MGFSNALSVLDAPSTGVPSCSLILLVIILLRSNSSAPEQSSFVLSWHCTMQIACPVSLSVSIFTAVPASSDDKLTITATRSGIDKQICLVLTAAGPKYCNKVALGKDVMARRVLNLYYDQGFAEILYREVLIHHSNVKSVWPRLFVISTDQGNPLANLYPTSARYWWPIVEDVFASAAVQALRANFLLTLERYEEYVPWYVIIHKRGFVLLCLSLLCFRQLF